jgi:WD40 repeat protein
MISNALNIKDTGFSMLESLVNLKDNKFACGGYDGQIAIKSIDKDYECVHVLLAHDTSVTALLFFDKFNLLLSGSFSGVIKVLDMNNYSCVRTITVWDGSIGCLELLPSGFFASGSDDHVKI